MSTYSLKRHQAVCAWPSCSEGGTKLAVFRGILDWWCDLHHDGLKELQ